MVSDAERSVFGLQKSLFSKTFVMKQTRRAVDRTVELLESELQYRPYGPSLQPQASSVPVITPRPFLSDQSPFQMAVCRTRMLYGSR